MMWTASARLFPFILNPPPPQLEKYHGQVRFEGEKTFTVTGPLNGQGNGMPGGGGGT